MFCFTNDMIIGITGKIGSGKDTVANILMKQGYEHISLSDFLREDLKRQKKPITRQNLIEHGSNIRKELGAQILAERAYSKIKTTNCVITSIGRTEEVEFFKEKNIKIIYVDATQKIRFERIKQRKRENDPQKFTEFKKLEKIESQGKNQTRNLDAIKKKADIILTNNTTLTALNKKIKEITKHTRPNWDEYFFKILDAVSTRGTCDRAYVACVIVKDNRILATGYNGAPPGVKQCDEIGHWMIKATYPDQGEKTHCIRTVHAEQNAIAHAAKYGISLEGATMYVNVQPCIHCTKLLISAGIKKVIARYNYPAGKFASQILKDAKINFKVLHKKNAY